MKKKKKLSVWGWTCYPPWEQMFGRDNLEDRFFLVSYLQKQKQCVYTYIRVCVYLRTRVNNGANKWSYGLRPPPPTPPPLQWIIPQLARFLIRVEETRPRRGLFYTSKEGRLRAREWGYIPSHDDKYQAPPPPPPPFNIYIYKFLLSFCVCAYTISHISFLFLYFLFKIIFFS